MSTVDFVTRPLKVTADTTFNLQDLIKTITRWGSKHGFDPYDADHAEIQRGDGKDYLLKLILYRDEDDYHESEIQIKVQGESLQFAKRKDQTCSKGKVTVVLRAILNKDVRSKWETSFTMHFFRSVWDRYVEGDKHDKYHAELDQETKDLHAELKSFLNVEKYKL